MAWCPQRATPPAALGAVADELRRVGELEALAERGPGPALGALVRERRGRVQRAAERPQRVAPICVGAAVTRERRMKPYVGR